MAAGVQCPHCGEMNLPDARICASCGGSFSAKQPSAAKLARARKLPTRVEASEAATVFEDEPPRSRPKPDVPKTTTGGSPRVDPLLGQKLQEYVIQERVGVGGMGIVYKAVQPLIGKEVAIKVLRPDVVTDPRDMERLLEEARVVNSIKHRGIINIFSAGTLEDGRHYLIMELLEGESLEQRMAREGTVPVGDASVILEEVLSALAAAHKAGIVHRDLKPANVFLVREGNRLYAKLLDFGLARRSLQAVTRIAGTPDYISPEHARGRPAGPPADLYAFGVLCFHMLTGQLPFTGTTPMEVMEKHVHHQPPVPTELNQGIPEALSDLILALLAKDPAARPEAAKVKADLRAATKELRLSATMLSMREMAPVDESTRVVPTADKKRAKTIAVARAPDTTPAARWPYILAAVAVLWLLAVVAYVVWPRASPASSPPKRSSPANP
jgi:eukaryotic-like serine/threonine-protein kinase